jgi:hypothetical protein
MRRGAVIRWNAVASGGRRLLGRLDQCEPSSGSGHARRPARTTQPADRGIRVRAKDQCPLDGGVATAFTASTKR